MEKRIINPIIIWLIFSTVLYTQGMWNRLRVPIQMKGTVGLGYDNNFLRLSDNEIKQDDVREYGISSTLDSPILKPKIKFIYSPEVISGKTTNIITSISYSHFNRAAHKSYLITNLSLELKLRSYSWLKIGIRDIPKYYLRDYHDRDLSNIDYFNCTFSSQKYFGSYSLPIKWIRKTWMRVYAEYAKEYYNPNFTEFDLNKWMLQIEMNHRFKKRHKMKLSIAHGYADNATYGSNQSSTSFDRSYIYEKVQGEFVNSLKQIRKIDQTGISIQLEQRYYDLISNHYSFDNWKYYLDGRIKLWINWDLMENINIRTWYQYRWRDADSQLFGDFEWVEDIKSYTKHEFWLEFSYEFITDILY